MAAMARSGTAMQMVIVEKSLGRAIGTCLIFAYDAGSSRAEIGYALGRAYWRNGYMTEALDRLVEWAFGDLELRRLEAQVDPQNVPSNVLLTNAGFTHEGTLRERWMTKGRICDTNMYGLLRKDW
jgi:RimJ/RimL family protein N-acetyltransferase